MRECVADLETDGLLPVATKVWCGVFIDRHTKEKFLFRPHQIKEMLSFMDTCHTLVFHNGLSFDWPVLEKLYDYVYKGKKVDTLIMSRLLNPSRRLPFNIPKGMGRIAPHSIEAWGYRVGRGKPSHDDWAQFSEAMLHRCAEDVEIGVLTLNALEEESRGQDWSAAFKLTFRLFEILHLQEEYGWLMDKEYMGKSIRLLQHWVDKIDKVLTPLLPLILVTEETKSAGEYRYVSKPYLKNGDYSAQTSNWYSKNRLDPKRVCVCGPFSRVSYRLVDLNSGQETKDFLLSEGWEPQEWNYKKENGKYVLDALKNMVKSSPKLSYEDPFDGISSGVGRLVAKRVQCRHRKSVIEGFLSRIREDGRIATPVAGLAETGRARHKDVANVPGEESFFGKQMRRCFICKEGFRIVGTDSKGCQNRMLAARVGDPFFTKTLIEGNKEEGTSIHQVNQKAILEYAGIEVTYGQSKNLNYAFMFGASDKKLGAIIGRSKDDGEKIRAALLGVAPGFEALVKSLTEEWRSNAKVRVVNTPWGVKTEYYDGWVRGLDGRPIFIAQEHTVLVYVLQSDEAIMMAAAYTMLFKRAEARGWKHGVDWGYLIWYHDEYQCEVREDLCPEFTVLAEQCITDAGKWFKIECLHEGEAKIGINWYETH